MSYAAGYATAVMGREVFFVEKECVGRGDARGLAYGSTDFKPGSEAARLARATGERAELQHFLEELEQRSLALLQEQARVRELESQVVYLQESLNETYNVRELVGVSSDFKRVMRNVAQVAGTDAALLLTGETGTGNDSARLVPQSGSG